MSEALRKYVGAKRDSPPWKDVRFRCSFHNTIYDVLKSRGFKETDAELDWDLFWCDKEWIHEVFDHIHLQPHQRVNHFRNHYELTRKDLLVKNLKRAQRQAQRDGLHEEARGFVDCHPISFVLPAEYSMFVEEFKKTPGGIWIMKPVGSAQGKGIFLFDKLSQISAWRQAPKWLQKVEETGRRKEDEEEQKKEAEPYVVQRYLSDPLLIGGKKFDLRLYVLVTSYAPLCVYMYRSGFARFSHTRFSMNSADLSNVMVHLTNVAVQKTGENYEPDKGKWDLHALKLYLMSIEEPDKVNALFCAIQDVVLFSLLAVQKIMIQDKHCFELYGYDIMISSDLKPWLIEVNASPSLTANTRDDYEMKFALLDDTMTILDFEKYLTGSEAQIGGFDLLYKNGARIGPPQNAGYKSYLGCHNNRVEQLKRLSRACAAEQDRKGQQQQSQPQPPSAAVQAEIQQRASKLDHGRAFS